MSSIYIYSPSGAVRDKAAFRRGIKRLQELGHEIQVDPSALKSIERFAGSDEERLASIERATTSGADIAMITRGGYGLSRLLSKMPYKKIAKAIHSGTTFVGLSDFTAFQMAVFAMTGLNTWAGPALISDFGSEQEPNEIMKLCFEDMVRGRGEGTGWKLNTSISKKLFIKALKGRSSLSIEDATLWGGNLAIVCSLLNTPYFPNIEGGILFLEDVGEHPYRIERMLLQLHQAGVLAKQKAIIFGAFTEFKLTPHDKGYKLSSVFEYISQQLKIPIICDLPFGHVPLKISLPFGEKVTLATQDQEVFLFWNQHRHHHDTSGHPDSH